jgi:chitin disaccharide deacetylase
MRKQLVTILKQTIRIFFFKSIQKRLGYSKNTKLLIIHADDMGMSGSENTATIEAMEKGTVNSGSVMVPCLKFQEIADYSKTHLKADIGIHLTITSEWPQYKWGPVLPHEEVESIIDSDGFFLENMDKIIKNANPVEVEKEFRAQIMRAMESGIELTHIDSHMYAAFSNNQLLKIYISLGKEYNLPVLLTNKLPIRSLMSKNLIVVEQLYCAKPEDYSIGLNYYYREILRSIKPGLNCILVHTAFNNEEMQNITRDQTNFGADWRQADFDFFTSEECSQLIRNNNIQLITWREIRTKLVR